MSSPTPEASTSRPPFPNLTIDTSPAGSSSHSGVHSCRWDWCREIFSNHVELVEHVLSTHANAAPIKRRDLVLEYKAHGRSLDLESALKTPSHSALNMLNPGLEVKHEDIPSFILEGSSSFQTPKRKTLRSVRAQSRTPAVQTPSRHRTPVNRQISLLRSPASVAGIPQHLLPSTPKRSSVPSQISTSLSGLGVSTPPTAANNRRSPGHAHVHTHAQIRFRALAETSSPAQTPETAHDSFIRSPSTAELIANLMNSTAATQRQLHDQHLHHHHYEILQHQPPVPPAQSSADGPSETYSGNHGLDPALTLKTSMKRKHVPSVTIKEEEQTDNGPIGSSNGSLQSAHINHDQSQSQGSQNGESSRPNANAADTSVGLPPREFRHGSLTLRTPSSIPQKVARISTGGNKPKMKMKARATIQEEHSRETGAVDVPMDESALQPASSNDIALSQTSSQNQSQLEPQPDSQHEPSQHNPLAFSQEPSSLPSQIGPALENSQWAVPLMTQPQYDYDYSLASSSQTQDAWL